MRAETKAKLEKRISERKKKYHASLVKGVDKDMTSSLSFDNMVKRNSELVIDPATVNGIVEWMVDQGADRFTTDEIAKATGCPHVPGYILHPSFIRSAAKRGVVFYVDYKLNIRRQNIKGLSQFNLESIVDGEIDANFYLEPEWLSDLAGFINRDESVLLIGPAGVGKSTAAVKIFNDMNQKFLKVSCTPSMSADDFEGTINLVDGDTVFTPAAPTIASERGLGLILEEVDAAPPEACYSLYELLNGNPMNITRKGHESLIYRDKKLRIIGSQNTEGRGDPRGLHHGRSYQDEAWLDRWEQTIRVDYPSEDNETLILRKRTGLSEKHTRRIVECANRIRSALTSNSIMFGMTMRRSQKVAGNIAAGYTPEKAWQFAVTNRATPEDQSAIGEILQRIYGPDLRKRPK